MDIRDATAVVTGGGTAIGRAIALELARRGARVVVLGRRRELLDETVALADGRCTAAACDVTDPADVARAFAATGPVDVLVNNAGSFAAVGALWDVDAEAWWGDVTTNLKGPMLCTKAVLPAMMARNSGIIVNLDGGGGANGANRGGSGYGASKAALARLTETLARELASAGSEVQVYGMFPGLVRSQMTENLIATPERARWQGFVEASFAQGRDRPSSDCARAIAELIGNAGPDLSGRIFDVDDDFAEVDRRRAHILAADSRIMRLRPLPWEPKR